MINSTERDLIPTEQEMTDVLAEFYRRGNRESKLGGVPQPFHIKVTDQVFHARTPVVEEASVPNTSRQGSAMVGKETEFDLVDAGLNLIATNTWQQVMRLSGHNRGKAVPNPIYLRVANSVYAILGPGIINPSGILNVLFNQSTWQPPQLPDYTALSCSLRCHDPQPTGPPGNYVMNINMQIAIQDSVTNEWATHIFGSWPWTDPPPPPAPNPGFISYSAAVVFQI